MNKAMIRAKNNIVNQRKKYLFLLVITLIGIISGLLFIYFISKTDKLLVFDELDSFFKNIKNYSLNYTSSLINSITSNCLFILIIWILGISIIGIPIIIFLLFLKGFIFGFSISSIISKFGLNGLLLSVGYHFPHNLIFIILYILISFYAINFSIRLFRVLFLKENINLTPYFRRYNKIFIISVIVSILCSFLEVFLAPILINFFL